MGVKVLMTQPYARILVMHGTLIAGAFAMVAVGDSKALLAVLVLLKTVADGRQHRREHRVVEQPQPATA